MKSLLLLLTLTVFLFGCGERSYHTVEVDNPAYKPNKVFESFEDMTSPRAEHLINKYRLDTVVNDATDELERILMLRNWIKSVITIKDFAAPYPGQGNVERILDYALEGEGFDCASFMRVQNAVMSSLGYVTRNIGAGPSVKDERDGHHGINEIWLNDHNKWFLSDAKYDHHFEKDGIPLSALEVRNEFLKNEGADILMVKGPDRIPQDFDEEMEMTKFEFEQTYTWISWDAYNDRFTNWPDYTELLILYEDDYYRNNTWYRGGRPHWVYGSPEHLKLVQDKDVLYFTPNTIASNVTIQQNIARIELVSDTPGLKEYQMNKQPDDSWIAIDPVFEMELQDKRYNLVFRAVNAAGVAGPEHRIVIDSN